MIAAGYAGLGLGSRGKQDGDFLETADGVFGGDGDAVAPHSSADSFAAAVEHGDDGLAGTLYGVGELI